MPEQEPRPSQELDEQAIAEALHTRSASVRDVAYGEGSQFSIGRGDARLEIYPRTGVTRLTTNDIRVELCGSAITDVCRPGAWSSPAASPARTPASPWCRAAESCSPWSLGASAPLSRLSPQPTSLTRYTPVVPSSPDGTISPLSEPLRRRRSPDLVPLTRLSLHRPSTALKAIRRPERPPRQRLRRTRQRVSSQLRQRPSRNASHSPAGWDGTPAFAPPGPVRS